MKRLLMGIIFLGIISGLMLNAFADEENEPRPSGADRFETHYSSLNIWEDGVESTYHEDEPQMLEFASTNLEFQALQGHIDASTNKLGRSEFWRYGKRTADIRYHLHGVNQAGNGELGDGEISIVVPAARMANELRDYRRITISSEGNTTVIHAVMRIGGRLFELERTFETTGEGLSALTELNLVEEINRLTSQLEERRLAYLADHSELSYGPNAYTRNFFRTNPLKPKDDHFDQARDDAPPPQIYTDPILAEDESNRKGVGDE